MIGESVEALPRWSLAWADEFNGAAGTPPDPDTWQPEIGGHGWGNGELQYYTDGVENAALDGDGHLAITVRRVEPQERYDGCRYTSARLISKDRARFRYGLMQARIKLPPGAGLWPAFWMLGQDIDAVGWPTCGEIDVMESLGDDPTAVRGTAHGPGYCGADGIGATRRIDADLADDFHRYAVHWEPERLRWYVDDELYHTVTPADLGANPWVFDHDFYLLLTVAVPGAFEDAIELPATMLVEYVRVYVPS